MSDAQAVAAFYRARSGRPLWTESGRLRPEAEAAVALIATAAEDGLDPARYGGPRLQALLARARSGDRRATEQAERALSEAFGRYAVDLRTPSRGQETAFPDPRLAPPDTIAAALRAAAAAPDLGAHLAALRRMHPLYEQLRTALSEARVDGDAADIRAILANMDRLRPLPRLAGRRHVLVDAASGRLWMYEDGRSRGAMKVVVGSPEHPTPLMAGVLTHSVLRPYWNIPEDLVRDRFAPRVLKDGVGVLRAENMEVLADWSETPARLDPAKVDWRSAAAGRIGLRVRQKPGPENMMGAIKFMLPNELGIYLHDTPNRALFAEPVRAFSAGCVRVEDARRLARWLHGRDVLRTGARTPEQRVDLSEPVPVHIVYLTVRPGAKGGLERSPDVYGRDGPRLQVAAGPARSAR